jgi:hypothetical protein
MGVNRLVCGRAEIQRFEARSVADRDGEAEASAYLEAKSKDNSRFPSGMTTRKATAKATA